MRERYILVTGSSSGIGRAISEHLLKSGATVIGLARNHRKFQPNSDNYKTLDVDISDLKNLPSSLKDMLAEYPKLDGFVSNAGYGKFGGLENHSPDQIYSFICANLISHMVITRMVLPHFKARKRGDIVYIGSEAALDGGKKGSLYCAAKFGLRGFSQSLREECASANVRVSIINPGMVRTQFFENLDFRPGDEPLNAIEPEDVALAAIAAFSARPGTVIDEINLTPLKKTISFD